ncbi:hypothetical protein WICMUC_004694 [Wickerhamomyces mucosus]|uniref:Protein-serine/threonine kinase n=1 Tax=Wickerhamomyces mucosus TaxID=1378264 RepID=A0A9P8PHJ6_9ASCO|nr:hypothetical protein WICMUC_004694 [Wickerhamomyces mucosus]
MLTRNKLLFNSKRHLITSIDSIKSKINPQTALSFEQEYKIRSSLEKLITDYSTKKLPKITLDSLINLSNTLQKNDPITLNIKTLNYLTIYNIKRLKEFRSLPYLTVLNPYISSTYELYLKSLELLLNISNLEKINDSELILTKLIEFQEIHRDAIPTLSKGFQEVSKFYPKFLIVKFLNNHFNDKINMETITNNYIKTLNSNNSQDNIGIIDKNLKISELIKTYGGFVNDMTFIKYYKQVPIEIDFGENIKFPYIGQHLEYIITEILKNSIRSHIESNKSDLPILITIVENSKTKDGKRSLGIRFRDEGGGIPTEIEQNIFDYSFSSVAKLEKNQGMVDNSIPGEGINTVAGMGYGLPLTKAYVEQFGGRLELQSCYGLGTDVYVELIGPDSCLINT